MNKLFKVSQDWNDNYDTYDSMIVCAKNEIEARGIHPNENVYLQNLTTSKNNEWWYRYSNMPSERHHDSDWIPYSEVDKLKVELIGTAAKGIPVGVVLASFNAG